MLGALYFKEKERWLYYLRGMQYVKFTVTFSAEICGFVFVKDYNLQKIITQEIAKNTLSFKVWA